jgi:HJR/Mrr/RecB family endonuclease
MESIRLVLIVAAAIVVAFLVFKVIGILVQLITWIFLIAVFALCLYVVWLLVRSSLRKRSDGLTGAKK